MTKDFSRPGNSGSYRDYLYVKKELERLGEVVTITKENIYSITNREFDFFFLMASQINFFGGKFDTFMGLKWDFIWSSRKPVFYWFVDFLIPLKRLDTIVLKRFNAYLAEPDIENLKVISFAKDTEGTVDWWNRQTDTVALLPNNIHYWDLTESYFKYVDLRQPQMNATGLVYIGNNRNGKRLDILNKAATNQVIDVYGNWQEKNPKYSSNLLFRDPIPETEVQDILNRFYAQIITYDEIGIKYQADSTRLGLTIASGTLPIIDSRLEYLETIPESLKDKLLFAHWQDVDKAMMMSYSDRAAVIKELQQHLTLRYLDTDFGGFVQSLIT